MSDTRDPRCDQCCHAPGEHPFTPSDPKFPHVHVELVGQDGNAFSIMGRVMRAMRRAGCTPEEVAAYQAEATSGDYDHLLQVTMCTVSCDSEDEWDDEWDEGIDEDE